MRPARIGARRVGPPSTSLPQQTLSDVDLNRPRLPAYSPPVHTQCRTHGIAPSPPLEYPPSHPTLTHTSSPSHPQPRTHL